MATTKNSICNMALVQLKANRVTDIDNPTTNEENICNILFDQLAKEVISSGSWSSCLKQASLVEDATAPTFGFDNRFQLPTDCLKVLAINECYDGSYPYEIHGDKLHTDLTTVKILYLFNNTNIASWDTQLVSTMVQRLIAALAKPLTGDLNRAKHEFEVYTQMLSFNLAINNQQGSKQIAQSNTLIDER